MNPDAYKYCLIASMAGGLVGALVMWNRKRTEVAGESNLRRLAVLTIGTAASACALFAFTRAFGEFARLYAVLVMVLVTGWAAVLQSVVSLPMPRFVLRVGTGEFAVLRARWTGIRLFGAFLRSTPLRHLGGRVYLSNADQDPQAVLCGLRAAEAVHLWALLCCGPWLVYWGTQRRWASLGWGLAVHVPLNVYPVLHLRYVTWRIERHLARTRRGEAA